MSRHVGEIPRLALLLHRDELRFGVVARLTRFVLAWQARRPCKDAVPVLTYHSIGDEPWGQLAQYRVSRRDFRQQMAFLATAGFAVVPLETIVARLDVGGSVPANWVAVTFDDGYQDFYLNALPVLRGHRFPATVFLVTNLMGGSATWLGHDMAPALMTWSQAREAIDYGITLSSHSATHPHLSRLADADLRREVAESRRTIHEQLNSAASIFCYPHGDFDDRVRSAVREAGYVAAFSTEVGLTTTAQHHYALHRVKIRPGDSTSDFVAKLFTGEAARGMWWRARRRGVR